MVRAERMRWLEYVARIEEEKTAIRVMMGGISGRRTGRPRIECCGGRSEGDRKK